MPYWLFSLGLVGAGMLGVPVLAGSCAYATTAHPRRACGKERPIWGQIQGAIRAWKSNYDYHKEYFTIDPKNFGQISR
jgi:hypothetical protein